MKDEVMQEVENKARGLIEAWASKADPNPFDFALDSGMQLPLSEVDGAALMTAFYHIFENTDYDKCRYSKEDLEKITSSEIVCVYHPNGALMRFYRDFAFLTECAISDKLGNFQPAFEAVLVSRGLSADDARETFLELETALFH